MSMIYNLFTERLSNLLSCLAMKIRFFNAALLVSGRPSLVTAIETSPILIGEQQIPTAPMSNLDPVQNVDVHDCELGKLFDQLQLSFLHSSSYCRLTTVYPLKLTELLLHLNRIMSTIS